MTALAFNPNNEVRPIKVDANGNLLVNLAVGGSSSPVKTIQKGSITLNGGVPSGTFTLGTAVTTGKAFVLHNGSTTVTGATLFETLAAVDLTNSTTVTALRASGTANAITVYFTVVEFV